MFRLLWSNIIWIVTVVEQESVISPSVAPDWSAWPGLRCFLVNTQACRLLVSSISCAGYCHSGGVGWFSFCNKFVRSSSSSYLRAVMVFALYTHHHHHHNPNLEHGNAHHSLSLVSTESQEFTKYDVAMLYIRSLLSDVIMCTSLSSLIKAAFYLWTSECCHHARYDHYFDYT